MTNSRVPDVARIVVLRANGLGDFAVAEPALAALRAAYPDATITLVTSSPVAALLDERPSPVDEVVIAPRVAGVRGEPGGPPDDPPEAVEAFCAAMRERRFDLGVQLHGGGGNANPLLLRFGARVTAGSRAPGAAGLTRTVTWTPYQHDVLRWLEVVALIGAEPVHLRPRIAVEQPIGPRRPMPSTVSAVRWSPCTPAPPTRGGGGRRDGSGSSAQRSPNGALGSCCSAETATPRWSTRSGQVSALRSAGPST